MTTVGELLALENPPDKVYFLEKTSEPEVNTFIKDFYLYTGAGLSLSPDKKNYTRPGFPPSNKDNRAPPQLRVYFYKKTSFEQVCHDGDDIGGCCGLDLLQTRPILYKSHENVPNPATKEEEAAAIKTAEDNCFMSICDKPYSPNSKLILPGVWILGGKVVPLSKRLRFDYPSPKNFVLHAEKIEGKFAGLTYYSGMRHVAKSSADFSSPGFIILNPTQVRAGLATSVVAAGFKPMLRWHNPNHNHYLTMFSNVKEAVQ